MPVETIPAANWVLEKLLKELSACKMYPVILGAMKHQEQLCILSFTSPKIIEILTFVSDYKCIFTIYGICIGTTMRSHAFELETSYTSIKDLLDKAFYTLQYGV